MNANGLSTDPEGHTIEFHEAPANREALQPCKYIFHSTHRPSRDRENGLPFNTQYVTQGPLRSVIVESSTTAAAEVSLRIDWDFLIADDHYSSD
jgi:hypothetical protein